MGRVVYQKPDNKTTEQQLRDEVHVLYTGLEELLKYLQSDKFYKDTTVQRDDMIRRINEIRVEYWNV